MRVNRLALGRADTGLGPAWAGASAAQLYGRAVAAWSVSRDMRRIGATPAVLAGSVITSIADQVGTRTLTSVGSPAIDTDGINANNFASMDGVDDYFTFPTLTLNRNFTIFFAVGKHTTSAANAVLGRITTTNTYIMMNAYTQVQLRSNTGGNVNFANGGFNRGFHVYRVRRQSGTISVFIDGMFVASSAGGLTQTGDYTFDQVGRASSGSFFNSGIGEIAIFNRALSDAACGTIEADMGAAWRSPLYFDPTLGNDANKGWNSAAPAQTLARARDEFFPPGQKFLLKSGEIFRNDRLTISESSNRFGTAAKPMLVDLYGGSTPAIIMGSTQITGAAWTLVTGTEYKKTAPEAGGPITDDAHGAWYIEAGVYTRLTIGGTAGALTLGQAQLNNGELHINIGKNPVSGVVEYAYTGGDAVLISADYWIVKNLTARHANQSGFRVGGLADRLEDTIAEYNAQDGHDSNGSGQDFYMLRCISRYNGYGLITAGSPGDGFSMHGGSTGTCEGCIALDNDKAGFNHEGNCRVTQIDCQASGSNIPCNLLDQGTGGTLKLVRGSYARKTGSSIRYVVGAQATTGALILEGAITLTDPEDAVDSIGIYSPTGITLTGNIAGATITYVNTATNISWGSAGTLTQ